MSAEEPTRKSGGVPDYMNEVKALSQLIQQNSKPVVVKDKEYGDSKKNYLNDDCSNFTSLCALDNDPNFLEKHSKASERTMRKLLLVSLMTLVFMIIMVIGGYIAGSTAIFADAAHMLSDVQGFMISFFSILISRSNTNFSNNYGYHRVEVLGAIISVMFLWGMLIGINGIAIYKIHLGNNKDGYLLDSHESAIFLLTAIFGLGCNLFNLFALNFFCNHEEEEVYRGSVVPKNSTNETLDDSVDSTMSEASKQHQKSLSSLISGALYKPRHAHKNLGYSLSSKKDGKEGVSDREKFIQQHESEKNRKLKQNLNMRAAIVHIVGDMIQSVGVIIAGIIICINPEKYSMADPICTFIFTSIVLMSTVGIFKDCINIILEKTPTEIDCRALYNDILGLKCIEEMHDFHCWQLSSDKYVLTCHVRSRHGEKAIKAVLEVCQQEKYGIYQVTVQVEDERPSVANNSCIQLTAYD